MALKSNTRVRIWVNPEFKKILKSMAGQKGKTLEDLTEELAENFGNFGKKKNEFNFRL
jgi:superoxide dismutase